MDNNNSLTYQDVIPKIEETYCKKNVNCWHPKVQANCPYRDVCFAEYKGNTKEAFETAIVKRYKELHNLD
jgi:hypothetical protein